MAQLTTKYVAPTLPFRQLDEAPFLSAHALRGHPVLEMESLGRILPKLPADQVFYSSSNLSKDDDFDRAHIEHKNGRSLVDTVRDMLHTDSYIVVRSPEVHPEFQPLFRELLDDVRAVVRAKGLPPRIADPMLYLFVSSPKAVTPFHIDRYSTLLFQIQGRKVLSLFPAWDERVVQSRYVEDFMVRSGARPPYHEGLERFATRFELTPGQMLHIPFLAPHHVANGTDEVSISVSIIFNTVQTVRLQEALLLNRLLRKLGRSPSTLMAHPVRDRCKAVLYRTMTKTLGRYAIQE